jgi:RNA-binding protein
LILMQLGYHARPKSRCDYRSMSNNYRDQKQLRAIGHKLKPIITVAQKGLSENILAEIDRALNAHELIKIRLATGAREEREELTERICGQSGATCVQSVGHVVLLYRAASHPDSRLSNILRHRVV